MKVFYSIDLLRFYASFIVFTGHYVHFGMHYNLNLDNYLFLNFGFGYGGLAVPSFFMISGVIFAHMYGEKIQNKKITIKEY